MKKVTLKMDILITMEIDDNAIVLEIVDELDYTFSDSTAKAVITNTEVLDYSVL